MPLDGDLVAPLDGRRHQRDTQVIARGVVTRTAIQGSTGTA